MRKQGLMAATLDFYSLLFFAFLVIGLLLLFRMSHDTFEADISTQFESGAAALNLRGMLRYPVEYQGHTLTLAQLAAMYAGENYADETHELYTLINSTVKQLCDNSGIQVLGFMVSVNNGLAHSGFDYLGNRNCEILQGSALIAGAMPPKIMPSLMPIQHQVVGAHISYCKNG
jgi:hypothetical protein